jgi:hypothetical protein
MPLVKPRKTKRTTPTAAANSSYSVAQGSNKKHSVAVRRTFYVIHFTKYAVRYTLYAIRLPPLFTTFTAKLFDR